MIQVIEVQSPCLLIVIQPLSYFGFLVSVCQKIGLMSDFQVAVVEQAFVASAYLYILGYFKIYKVHMIG